VKRIIALAGLLLIPVLVVLPAASAGASPLFRSDTSDFVFESFDADYTLSRDAAGLSEMRVVETLVAIFPSFDQNRGILRTIPRYYGQTPLYLGDFTVTDENGSPVPFEQSDVDTSPEGSNAYEYRAVELALGTDAFVHGRTTYVISYTTHNVIRHFDDSAGDELYWDVNGTEWAQPFGRVSVNVHVDDSLVSALTGATSCYAGYYGADEPCEVQDGGPGEFSASVTDLGGYSNMTVALGFDGGTFAQPKLPQDSWVITKAPLWLLYAALCLLLVAFAVRYLFWRDSRGRGIIVAQYTVPADRDLLEAGDLVERESTAMAAQFVDLAVQGYVQVVDLHPGGADFGDKDRFALDFLSKDGATAAELTILKILFDDLDLPGQRVQLATLSTSVGAALYGQRAKARRDSIKNERRARPAGRIDTWLRRVGFLIGAGYVAILVWALFSDVDFGPMIGFAIVSIVVLIIASGVLSKPYLLTGAGAEARDYLLGMREYLTIAEEDRLRVLQSPQGADRAVTSDRRAIVELHEKLLPYAVLWGVEKQWSRQLEVDYSAIGENPSWLNNDLSSINLGNLVSSFSMSSTSAVRPVVATSSSSGGGSWSSGGGSSFSSGSSGGGFSGGGGGGGGGGGR
jgi:uncharacterized membrane protein YgcG